MNLIHFKKESPTIKFDESQETDSQMLIRVTKKFALTLIVILMFDTLFDWVIGLLDLLSESFHLIIEAIEYLIEVILEHTFQTDHQQSEIIIVNGAIILSLYLTYRLYLATPKLCLKISNKCLLYLDHKSKYWHNLPLARKFKTATTYIIGTSIILFFVTL